MKSFRRKAVVFMSAIYLSLGLLFSASPALAVSLPPLVPDCARGEAARTTPSLNCALQTFGNIANIILGLTGSFALLMFVYGGFTLLTSGGSQEAVTKGKTIIQNSVIGIVIILGSGYVITYGLEQLGIKDVPIAGTECNDGNGINISLPNGVECLPKSGGCKQLNTKLKLESNLYACMNVSQGTECITGICPGALDNQCCRPRSAAPAAAPRPTAGQECYNNPQKPTIIYTCQDVTGWTGPQKTEFGCVTGKCSGNANNLCCPSGNR
ncbi:hypothetical protein HY633_01930 [Candidatus Uhrbacteria bacterium]|nr:hypothetical protein [Candidatus Uhrbacteria bacterium]